MKKKGEGKRKRKKGKREGKMKKEGKRATGIGIDGRGKWEREKGTEGRKSCNISLF